MVDRRNGVEQSAFVYAVIGGAILLKAAQAARECLAVVAGVGVHDAHQVERPHLDNDSASLAGKIASIDCDTKCFVGVAGVIGQAGEVIEALSLTGFIAA